jgi:hypothetical protein
MDKQQPWRRSRRLRVVHYGTNPKDVSQTAKSPIRLNPGHTYTVFRVRMDDLPPPTICDYKVDSMESNGKSDGVTSPVKHFHHTLMAGKNTGTRLSTHVVELCFSDEELFRFTQSANVLHQSVDLFLTEASPESRHISSPLSDNVSQLRLRLLLNLDRVKICGM